MPKISKKITIDPDNLVGVREITERLAALGYKVERSHITTWISRREDFTAISESSKPPRRGNGFPLPLKQLGMGGVYNWEQVLPWVQARYGVPVREAS